MKCSIFSKSFKPVSFDFTIVKCKRIEYIPNGSKVSQPVRDQVKRLEQPFYPVHQLSTSMQMERQVTIKILNFCKNQERPTKGNAGIVATIFLQMGNSMQAVLSTPIS